MQRKLGRTVAAMFIAGIASAAFASTASAGLITQTATTCDDGAITQPFTRWSDRHNYKLVPGGSFEQGASGWTLSGGATVVSGNETYNVGGAGHSKSLKLPSGSRAVSPITCVGLAEPTLRLVRQAQHRAARPRVDPVRRDPGPDQPRAVAWLPVLPGDLGGSSWHPTVQMPLLANILPLSQVDRTPVRFRFTPVLGSWQIDNVYVDPMSRR